MSSTVHKDALGATEDLGSRKFHRASSYELGDIAEAEDIVDVQKFSKLCIVVIFVEALDPEQV